MRKGTSQHAIAAKCHYHGASCSVLKTAKAFVAGNASFERVMSWLYEGKRRVPLRSDAAAHKRLYGVPLNVSVLSGVFCF